MNVKMLPTRDGYGHGLLELGAANPDVLVLDADLAKSTRSDWFAAKYPDRFFDIGIAEQDMIGTAAGLSLGGKIPFATTYGVFVAGRAWDQIRTTVCYSGLNVKIAGAHGGISAGGDGATHQALEDIALMRVLPNMRVIVPCDAMLPPVCPGSNAGIHRRGRFLRHWQSQYPAEWNRCNNHRRRAHRL